MPRRGVLTPSSSTRRAASPVGVEQRLGLLEPAGVDVADGGVGAQAEHLVGRLRVAEVFDLALELRDRRVAGPERAGCCYHNSWSKRFSSNVEESWFMDWHSQKIC